MRSRRLLLIVASLLTVASGWLAPFARAQQDQKPVAIVSMAPLDRLLKDTSYIMKAANVPEFAGVVSFMANQYTQGIDTALPWGLSVSLDGQNPVGQIFLPMKDTSKFFAALGTMGIEPDDLGDGMYEIDANGTTLFAKDMNGWLYVSQSEDALSSVPADPALVLGDLPNRYDIAIKLDVQALPAELRQMATDQMRIGLENSLNEQPGLTDEERAAAEESTEAQMAQMEELINDTERVIFGWAIDSVEQKTYFDAAAQFLAGTKFAEQADAMNNLTSDFAGFKLPGASAFFRATSVYSSEADKEMAKQSLRGSISQARDRVEAEVPAEIRDQVLDLMDGLAKLTEDTIDEGTFDGAGSLSIADESLRLLVGGRVADGRVLETELQKLLEGLPDSPQKPVANFGYETYKDVTLHSLKLPINVSDMNARKVFGDELKLWVGTADKAFMLSLDPAGDGSLKAAIDAMGDSSNSSVTPLQGVIEFTPLMQFAQAVSPNSILDNALQAIMQYTGRDKLQVMGSVIERGGIYRLSIDEGVLKAAGTAAKSGTEGGGF